MGDYYGADCAGANAGNYAIFAGGSNENSDGRCGYVRAFNSSLTRSTLTGLSYNVDDLAGATVGNYAIFAGGYGTGAEELNEERILSIFFMNV